MFVVDSSGSIQAQNWPVILNFIKNLVRNFAIGPQNAQVKFPGMLIYLLISFFKNISDIICK